MFVHFRLSGRRKIFSAHLARRSALTGMDSTEIRAAVSAALKSIVPDFDADRIDPQKPLRPQLDLDSMDWLNVIVGLHERLRVDIPESDYGRLTTLEAVVAYLAARLSD